MLRNSPNMILLKFSIPSLAYYKKSIMIYSGQSGFFEVGYQPISAEVNVVEAWVNIATKKCYEGFNPQFTE